MAKNKFSTVTLRQDQDPLVKEWARAIYGDKHGIKSRFVREAVDEKVEREKLKSEAKRQAAQGQ